jgi:N-acetylmuramic acid 6-phosphate etherase
VALVAGIDELAGSPEEAAAEDDAEAGAAAIRALSPGEHDVVIGVTASGRTPYVLGALAAATTSLVAAVTCVPFAAAAGFRIETPVGPEAISGSTRLKAGTAQKLVLNAFSTAVMVRRGRTYGNLMAGMRVANEKLRARAIRVCVLATGCTEQAAALALQDAQTARVRLDASSGAIRPAVEKWS